METKIVATIPRRMERTAQRLLVDGLAVRGTKNSFIIDLSPTQNTPDFLEYELPEYLIKRATLKINGFEYGHNGEAQVVCGMQGTMMIPIYVLKETACFAKPVTLMTVKGYKNQYLEIWMHEMCLDEKRIELVRLCKKNVWRGFVSELPFKFWVFRDAAVAVLKRASSEDELDQPVFFLLNNK
jgi:hypothetical protein